MFSERIPKPDTLEGITRNAGDGMETELILMPAVVQEILATVPAELIKQVIESGCLTALERYMFPTDVKLVVYDDRVGLYCRDELGVTRLSIDSVIPEALAWGESIYEEVRAEALHVDLLERVP